LGGLNLAAMYDIYGAPVPNFGNNPFLVTVGNVVGGGSYVNGMQFDRGADADYDAWAELVNEGWGWSDLEPYFKKMTSMGRQGKRTRSLASLTKQTHMEVALSRSQYRTTSSWT
jgi:choline dehydrogenase-like flavoprotein